MKILHIHSRDYTGGGGGTIAMDRLHRALMKAGVESTVMCGKKSLQSSHSIEIPKTRFSNRGERYLKVLTSQLGLNDVNYLSSFNVKKTQAYQEADIIHIHGTHGHFNYLAIPELTKTKPAVWTLHDMWPLTGHCVHSGDCERWKNGCGKCPYPESHPPIKRDGTSIEWKLKKWVYSKSDLTIIALSNWLYGLAKDSLLNKFPIHLIPNGIDTDIYRPHDPEQCRSLLGIPEGKKVLMFVSLQLDAISKGADLLIKSLQTLPKSIKDESVLLLLGDGGEMIGNAVNIPIVNLGFVRNDQLKAICFSAADLFIFPSRAESFGLVLAESMACGTPAVSFNATGMTDLVRSGTTGYLAEFENVDDFRSGIIQLLEDDALLQRMKQHSRDTIVNEFSEKLVLQKHIDLYKNILESRKL